MEERESPARGVRSLPDLAGSLLSLILSLRSSKISGQETELRARIGEYLDRIDREGQRAGIARDDLEEAKFPLVAFIDETILNSDWSGRDQWMERPLQLELYGETVSGEKFFDRMERVRRGGEAKSDLLEIYYLCLALGFEGKYKILGQSRTRFGGSSVTLEPLPARPRSPRTAVGARRFDLRNEAASRFSAWSWDLSPGSSFSTSLSS
jgi:type VI secretion system protein ImpK